MKTIQRISIVQQVADSISDYIQSSDLQVGDRLPTEMELCEQHGVGRGTVREAFRLLQSSGMIEIRPNRGAFVASKAMDTDNIDEWFKNNESKVRDIVEVRIVMEPLAARLMARHCTDENIAHLNRIHSRFMKAAETGDLQEMARMDARFHSYIAEKSGNELLKVLSKKLNDSIELYCNRTYQVPGHSGYAISPHMDIVRAIESRNPDVSEQAMKKHMAAVESTLDEVIRSTKQ